MFLLSLPAWVSEQPQNTQHHYYGVGAENGAGAKQIEQAKLKALLDLASRVTLTVGVSNSDTRETTQKSTFFGSYTDVQNSKQAIVLSAYLSEVPGVSVKKVEVCDQVTYCLVQLDRVVLQTYFFGKLRDSLEEAKYLWLRPARWHVNDRKELLRVEEDLYPDKIEKFKQFLDRANDLGVPTFEFTTQYNALQFNKRPIPEIVVEFSNRPLFTPTVVVGPKSKSANKPR